uniref:NADH-ubiquinone oxidoreductase chain 6 n=1 Tax=Dixella aestivalis TaxID=1780471 RepID=A0A0X9LAI2_9DIPT|nr:NADH dehydrogenase subunit 6 [Dixella aestivalis]ALZ48586.1 NADH dehydrogenase subunit 6 [Dixella aestivalis]
MLQFFVTMISLMVSFIFTQMKHPLAMGMMLLIQTLLICLITGMMSNTFWFSYVLFLTFLGGMLVLFIYVTSLASNEMFSLSMKITMMFFFILMITAFMTLIMDKSLIYSYFNNNEMNSITQKTSFIQENSIILNKLYNYPTNLINLLMMNYLFLTLIAVVKITNIFYGPLRQMN